MSRGWNGKETGNYWGIYIYICKLTIGLYKGYNCIMENKRETAI